MTTEIIFKDGGTLTIPNGQFASGNGEQWNFGVLIKGEKDTRLGHLIIEDREGWAFVKAGGMCIGSASQGFPLWGSELYILGIRHPDFKNIKEINYRGSRNGKENNFNP